METFLKQSSVDEILRGKSGELVNKRESAEKTFIQARNKSRSEVNKIITQTEKRATQQSTIINQTLQSQGKNLEARIHRRKTMSNRSVYSEREDPDIEERNPSFKHIHMDLDLDLQLNMDRLGQSNSGHSRPLNSGRENQGKRVFI